MATSSVSIYVRGLSDYNESLVECCRCRRSMGDPAMLNCLHNCCRSCLVSTATQTPNLPLSFECPVCCESTEHWTVTSNGLLCNYKRLSDLGSEMVYCKTCDAKDVAAVFWCAECCMGLCTSCYSWHNRFTRRHRSAELEIVRTWPASHLTPAVQCSMHKRHATMLCFTCRAPKCQLCFASCQAERHDAQTLELTENMDHLPTLKKTITELNEKLGRAVSRLYWKCEDASNRLRNDALSKTRLLFRNRQYLQDAIITAFDASVREVCVNLERIWCMCKLILVRQLTLGETANLTADIEVMCSGRLVREHRLRKECFSRCISSFGALLWRSRTYWQENGSFIIDGRIPHTSDIVLRSGLGTTDYRRAAPPAPLLFGKPRVTFQALVDCCDLAVTQDFTVLLAARKNGLLVYSDCGQELSKWLPAKWSDTEEDEVHSVAALRDGRAAVGVFYARLVVVLRRSSETGNTWLKDRHVAVLQSPPWYMAAHDDLLATADSTPDDEQQQDWQPGRKVLLLRLSSGELLYTHSRDYDIRRVALTALCLVTASRGPVKRNSGATPYVVDAFSHGGEYMWRHETGDDEVVRGLCAASNWHQVYVTVWRSDLSSSKVMAISGADGRYKTDAIVSRRHGLLLPAWLSLARGQQRTVLAVLNCDRAARQDRTVTTYEVTRK